jgi:hypothetical protein
MIFNFLKPKIDLSIIGLPITEDSVTEEFKYFVSQDKKLAFFSAIHYDLNDMYSNGDYINAQVGHNKLFEQGFIFKDISNFDGNTKKVIFPLNLWYNLGERNSPQNVVENIISTVKQFKRKYPDYTCVYMVPGSPFYHDAVSKILIKKIKNIKIIKTKSSADILCDNLKIILNKNLRFNIIEDVDNIKLKKGNVNIFACLGSVYESSIKRYYKNYSLSLITKQIEIGDKIYGSQFGPKNTINEYTKKQFEKMIEEKNPYMNYQIFAIEKNV